MVSNMSGETWALETPECRAHRVSGSYWGTSNKVCDLYNADCGDGVKVGYFPLHGPRKAEQGRVS